MTIKHLYPSQRPSLDLNFARTKRLDPRVDFERFSVGTYVGNDGLIKTAVDHEPRFDHDPETGESLGLLVEESRTNYALYSESPSNWSVTASNGEALPTITPNFLDPSGQMNAGRFQGVRAGTGNVRVVFPTSATLPNPHDVIYSVWLKSNTGANQTIKLYIAVADTIVEVTPEWKRFNCPVRTASSTSEFIALEMDNFTSQNCDILVWAPQLEVGTFLTSNIPTTSSTVTRAADVVDLTNTGVYDTDSFTILNDPYGAAGGGSTLNIVGGGQTPVKRTTVYNQDFSQSQINTLVKKDDEFWRWRILGSSFALPGSFTIGGQLTVDWGDGTVEIYTGGEHTFTNGGGYHDVGFRLDSGPYWRPFVNNDASHDTKVVAVGPAPDSMTLNAYNAFNGCTNLKVFDATIDATADTSFNQAWYNCSSLTGFPLINTSGITDFYRGWAGCSSLTSFPLIDTSSGTTFQNAWLNCSSLTSFPLIDTSSGTNFSSTWSGCFNLTSFPLLDTSSGTNFQGAWYNCSSLTSFPLIDTSSGTNFYQAWRNCSSLTSFPLIDTSSGTSFYVAWLDCSSLTSFPLIDTSNGTTFYAAWNGCSSLTTFPAGFFDSWTGTPANNCFVVAWDNCSSLTATSVENILNSIDTSGQSAPASGVDITIDYDAGTGTPSVSTAVTNLKSRGWAITLNGVAQ